MPAPALNRTPTAWTHQVAHMTVSAQPDMLCMVEYVQVAYHSFLSFLFRMWLGNTPILCSSTVLNFA